MGQCIFINFETKMSFRRRSVSLRDKMYDKFHFFLKLLNEQRAGGSIVTINVLQLCCCLESCLHSHVC